MINEIFNSCKLLNFLIWLLTSQRTFYFLTHSLCILKYSIVGEDYVSFWPLECQRSQLIIFYFVEILAHVGFLAVWTAFIRLIACSDAVLTKRRDATITLFWPLKYHFTKFTKILSLHRLTSALFRVQRKLSIVIFRISNTRYLLVQVSLVYDKFLWRSDSLCLFNHMT